MFEEASALRKFGELSVDEDFKAVLLKNKSK
jgi:hypothetical protein